MCEVLRVGASAVGGACLQEAAYRQPYAQEHSLLHVAVREDDGQHSCDTCHTSNCMSQVKCHIACHTSNFPLRVSTCIRAVEQSPAGQAVGQRAKALGEEHTHGKNCAFADAAEEVHAAGLGVVREGI